MMTGVGKMGNLRRNRRRSSRKGGFTLVEVVVSGALLLLLALMAAQGFAVCNHLVLRNRQFRSADELLEERIVWGNPPAYRENVTLEVGDYGTWDVVIETYEKKVRDADTSFKILRKREYEK